MLVRKKSELSWQVADDDEAWRKLTEQASAAGEPSAAARQGTRARHRLVGAALFAALFAVVLAGYLYRQASAGLTQTESELAAMVEVERWAAASESEVALTATLDPAAPAVWRTRILLENVHSDPGPLTEAPAAGARPIRFRDDIALIEVTDHSVTGASYVAQRFYRQTEAGWVRTSPRPELWGPMRHRETDFFIFHFRERDDASVRAVAAEIDEAYADWRAELGLPAPDLAMKRTVYVTVPATPDFDMLTFRFIQGSLEIPSPLLLPLREDASPAQALEQTIRQALINDLFRERQERFPVPLMWHSLLEGVRMWELQQASNSVAWNVDVMRWLYAEWPAIQASERQLHEYEADWLCDVSSGSAPLIENRLLPDDCAGEDPDQLLMWIPLPPQGLHDLLGLYDEPGLPSSQRHWVQSWQRRAGLASVVNYGVETYGRDTLPMLLLATAKHENWDTLIPAVYGVSLEQFEAGWLASIMQ